MHNKSILIYTQNSFFDPLFYGTCIAYFKELTKDKAFEFHVISHEQKQYSLPKENYESKINELQGFQIYHYPLQWKSLRFKLLAKLIEFLQGLYLVSKLQRKHRCKAIFALANIAGAYAYYISKLFRLKLILFTYEPHSSFMVETGTWNRKSLKYKLLNRIEYRMGMKADYIATGTKYMVDQLKNWGSRAKIYRVPSCIDESIFDFNAEARNKIRQQLKIEDKTVFVYVGKFGDLYYHFETISLFKTLFDHIRQAHFLVLTPNDKHEIEGIFEKFQLPKSSYYIDCVEISQVPMYLSASDFGIVAVPPLPFQKFRSPIKVGEYLCCGIPYLVCKGVSEDDEWAIQQQVGVVLKDFSTPSVKEKIPEIEKYISENKEQQRIRCRETGISYRSKQIAIRAFIEIFNEIYT